MDYLIDELKALSAKATKQIDIIKTEEATKNALVMPFIGTLGYNVFDPTEVMPEFTADIGTKKGEKVDYAILKDDKPIMLFECKWCGVNLDNEHKSQLYRYFTVTEARFAVLTNGVIYRFYTDIEEPNKMDSKPFLEFNLLDINEYVVDDLQRFSKSFFDVNEILTAATELKYTKEIKRLFAEQTNNPSENFVRFFASQVYTGKLTQAVKQQFTELTKKALNQLINDRVNSRLKSALAVEEAVSPVVSTQKNFEEPKSNSEKLKNKAEKKNSIVTTEEEIEGHKIIREILKDVVVQDKVVMRDKQSYCSILFDDNNRKPICRMYFNNSSKKRLGIFDENKNEDKVPIGEIGEISQHADKIKAVVKYYLSL